MPPWRRSARKKSACSLKRCGVRRPRRRAKTRTLPPSRSLRRSALRRSSPAKWRKSLRARQRATPNLKQSERPAQPGRQSGRPKPPAWQRKRSRKLRKRAKLFARKCLCSPTLKTGSRYLGRPTSRSCYARSTGQRRMRPISASSTACLSKVVDSTAQSFRLRRRVMWSTRRSPTPCRAARQGPCTRCTTTPPRPCLSIFEARRSERLTSRWTRSSSTRLSTQPQ